MRLKFFDCETTGTNTQEDEILELGWAIYNKDNATPMICKSYFLRNLKCQISAEITEITGITQEMIDTFGRDQIDVFREFLEDMVKYNVTVLVGHNAHDFDADILRNNMARHGLILPNTVVADTLTDIKYRTKSKSLRLSYLLADHGYINPFPHRALTDAMGCAILAYQYDIDKMLEIAATPMIEIRADVTKAKKDLAKNLGYQWDGERVIWRKRIREYYLKEEMQKASFPVLVLQRSVKASTAASVPTINENLKPFANEQTALNLG